MSEKILFVDDEEAILNSIERVFADADMTILRASSAGEALGLFEKQEIAVVVSDNQMPGMKGVDFLAGLKDVSPHSIKILMTAYADLPTALEAINKGEVFRFVVKPWDNEDLVASITQALGRYRLLKAMHCEDEAVLESLAQAIELKDPFTKGHCARVATYSSMIVDSLGVSERLRKEIRIGSWLHDCGKIGVPEAVLNYSGPLGPQDFETVKRHPGWGADLVRKAKLSPVVLNIVLYHHERYDGEGYPAGLAGKDIPLEARIVAIADIYDALTSARPYRKAYPWKKAVEIVTLMKGSILDPALVDTFVDSLRKEGILPDDA